MYSGADLTLKENLEKPFFQFFKNETMDHIVGIAIEFKNMNNAGATIVEDCTFYDNIGSYGGSINMEEGGSLIGLKNHFFLDKADQEMPEKLMDVIEVKDAREIEYIGEIDIWYDLPSPDYKKPSFAGRIRDSIIDSDVKLEDLLDPDLWEAVDSLECIFGQVRQYNSVGNLAGYYDKVIVAEGMTFGDYLDSKLDRRPLRLDVASVFIDNVFENLMGSSASAITVDSTFAIFIAQDKELINFKNNIATVGSTVYSNSATILMRGIKMENNLGFKGGCIWILSSEFDANKSSFTDNKAIQGGVIFAIQKSFFQIRNSVLRNNIAEDGGIIYAMSCTNQSDGRVARYIDLVDEEGELVPSLLFLNSEISHNWAIQNMMQIILSDAQISNCSINDNYSYQVTHGITLISSTMVVDTTQISFSESMQDRVMQLFLDKLDTGFFNLYLFSDLVLTQGTEVRNLIAQKSAVLSASALSNIHTSHDVKFVGNTALNNDGQTLSLENTETVEIEDTEFSGNPQVNIKLRLGSIEVKNSIFTDGKDQHIYAENSSVSLDGVTIRDSEDLSATGHGLYCLTCIGLHVTNSSFQRLRSNMAPAIKVEEQLGLQTTI